MFDDGSDSVPTLVRWLLLSLSHLTVVKTVHEIGSKYYHVKDFLAIMYMDINCNAQDQRSCDYEIFCLVACL